jgi:hypothetical protein
MWNAAPNAVVLVAPAVARRLLVVALMILGLSACDPSPPEYVYIRTDSVVVTLMVQSESAVHVGDWVRLRASRTTTGHWERVRFADVPQGSAWIGYVPPEHEAEVAANLQWFAEPTEGVEFDSVVPKPVPITERAVRFASPGTYRLWASSHAPLDATSNTLQILVTAR